MPPEHSYTDRKEVREYMSLYNGTFCSASWSIVHALRGLPSARQAYAAPAIVSERATTGGWGLRSLYSRSIDGKCLSANSSEREMSSMQERAT